MTSSTYNLLIAGLSGLAIFAGFALMRRHPKATLIAGAIFLVFNLIISTSLAIFGINQFGLDPSLTVLWAVFSYFLLGLLVWRTLRYRRTGK